MEATTDQIATVAALNDIARRTMGVTCRTVITQGIAALDENTQTDILKMIEGFEDFTPDNDPHGEHDAGFLYRDVIGQWHTRWTDDSARPALSVMWKFDLYEETVVKNTFCVSFPVRLPAPLPPYSDPIDWLRSFRGQLMHNPCIDLYPVEAEAAYHNPYSHPRIEQRRMRTKLLLGVSRRHQSSRSRIAPTRVALLSLLQHRHQTARSSAPCGTSPVSTKRQSAISNFRASATIPTLAARPPFPLKRLRYQTANSLLG